MEPLEISGERPLVLVVGYDGTEPAQRALEVAAKTLQTKEGRLEVVYIAHTPSTVAFSAQAVASVREGFDNEEQLLIKRADEALTPTGVKWHFQRRNGEIAPELLAVGEEQLGADGPSTHVVLILGGSAHKVDRYLNSTPSKVIRQDRFEVLVVP